MNLSELGAQDVPLTIFERHLQIDCSGIMYIQYYNFR